MNFAVPADHRLKLKESEKRNKYLDLARELKKKQKLCNMKMTVILVVAGELGTIPKGLVRGLEDLEIRGQVETFQTTTLRSTKILRRTLETWGNLLSLKLQRKTIS